MSVVGFDSTTDLISLGAGSYAADCAATGTDAAAGRAVVAMPLARGGAGAGAASSSSLAAFGGAFCAMEAQLMMLSEGKHEAKGNEEETARRMEVSRWCPVRA